MSAHRTHRSRSPLHRILLRLLPVGLALCTLSGGPALRAGEATDPPALHAMHHHGGQPMTQADMRRWVDDFYATHPLRGEPAIGAATVTINVFNFGFDADGNTTNVDTVRVFLGDIVQWHWVSGIHTTTNGTGALDPNAGLLFDQLIDVDHQNFSFQFTSSGMVPFFCRPHEGLMLGFVLVRSPTDVVPIDGRDRRPGFVDGPAPNPTHDSATFRFALGGSGRVRVEVYDARGRRVATAVDRTLGPGAYAAAWDGRSASGERVAAGAYFLRLAGPGVSDSREIIVTR